MAEATRRRGAASFSLRVGGAAEPLGAALGAGELARSLGRADVPAACARHAPLVSRVQCAVVSRGGGVFGVAHHGANPTRVRPAAGGEEVVLVERGVDTYGPLAHGDVVVLCDGAEAVFEDDTRPAKAPRREASEVVVLEDQEEEEEPDVVVLGENKAGANWRPAAFRLLRSLGVPRGSDGDSVASSLADLIPQDAGRTVEKAVVGQFMFSFDHVQRTCPQLLEIEDVVWLLESDDLPRRARERNFRLKGKAYNVSEELKAAGVMDRYGSHHSKFVLLFFASGLRVIVFTCNFLKIDVEHKSNIVWSQDFPTKSGPGSPGGSDFEENLVHYLEAYRGRVDAETLARIRAVDFSRASAHFVASVPGRHTGAALNRWGQNRVRELLSCERFPGRFAGSPLVLQFSSLSSVGPGKGNGRTKWFDSLVSSFSPPSLGAPRSVKIVWPSDGCVRRSVEGFAAGCSMPGEKANIDKAREQHVQFCVWDPSRGADGAGGGVYGRSRNMPHVKTYVRYLEGQAGGPPEVAFVLATSSNLSQAAHGVREKNDTQLFIKSFEAGVLVVPSLLARHGDASFSCTAAPSPGRCLPLIAQPCERVRLFAGPATAGDDPAVEVPVPYALPPAQYSAADEPYAWKEPMRGVDSFGARQSGAGLTVPQRGFWFSSVYGTETPPHLPA